MVRSLHESDDQLELYALDRLPDVAVARVEEHLMACTTCRTRVEEVGMFALTMRQALRTMPALKLHRRAGWFEGWRLRFTFSGAFAFAVLLAFFAIRNGREAGLPPVASITLTAMRGATATTPRAKQFDLVLADSASRDKQLAEVVDATGKLVWSGPVEAEGADTHLRIASALPLGAYFVRLKQPTGTLIREYGFEVR